MTQPGEGSSLDGRRFRPRADVAGGEVGPETIFEFHEDGDLIHGRYAGGRVRAGFLVGVRRGLLLHYRYVQLNTDGETAGGVSDGELELLPDGRARLVERWSWESRSGGGESTLEEFRALDA